MVELMGAIFAGIWFFLCFLFNMFISLGGLFFENLPEGQRRFTINRIIAGIGPLLSLLATFAFIFLICVWFKRAADLKSARIEETKIILAETATIVADDVDDGGIVNWPLSEEIDRADAWGHKIQFSCENSITKQHVHVVSAGPDAEVGTKDDLSKVVSSDLSKLGVAKGIYDKAKQAFSSDEKGQ